MDEDPPGPLSVGQLAELAGVTVRTLHHYDEIGLVRPSRRSAAGYRAYTAADVERLRQVLVYRRLGFGLAEVAQMVSDPSVDAVAHLRRQRELLVAQRNHMDALVAAIDKELEARVMEISLTPQEQLEVFGTSEPGGEWADEAQERWGSTDAYKESSRRASAYSKEDWGRIKAEADGCVTAFAAALRAGWPASGPGPMDLAEQHRQHICRNFYDCGHEMHRGLADMYLADARFAGSFDAVEAGLAQYIHDAIGANADRQPASPAGALPRYPTRPAARQNVAAMISQVSRRLLAEISALPVELYLLVKESQRSSQETADDSTTGQAAQRRQRHPDARPWRLAGPGWPADGKRRPVGA